MSYVLALELCREFREHPAAVQFYKVAMALDGLNLDELHSIAREVGALAPGAIVRHKAELEERIRLTLIGGR